MSELLRPRLGGEGEGDGLVNKVTGCRDAAVIGDNGDSRMSGASCLSREDDVDTVVGRGEEDEGPARASKADMRDWIVVEGIRDGCCR